MKRGNYPLWAAVCFVTLYWSVAPFIPKPFVRNFGSILALTATAALINKYLTTAWDVMVNQDRDDTGAHWAIVGAVTSSIGVAWTCAFSMLWIYYGMPTTWSATATSAFGFYLIAIGKWLMSVSPDTVRLGSTYPMGFWKLVVAVFALIVAYLAGAYFSNI